MKATHAFLMLNLLVGFVGVCLFFAAISDLYCRRIPNFIAVAVFITGVGYKLLAGSWADSFVDLIPFFVILSMGLVAFQYHVLAGGDVKLLTVCGYFVGMEHWLLLCVWTAVFGGAMALIILAWHLIMVFCGVVFGQRRERQGLAEIEMPYGVAIVAAAVLVITRQHFSGALEVSP